ncbi:MAG: hypothetical protein H6935_08885 [Thiobacillus sp.]|nr:hypothetical protein [Thiobacillus sp.]
MLVLLLLAGAYPASADTVIDARRNPEAAADDYRKVIAHGIRHGRLQERITLLVDGRRGFDGGLLRLPNELRTLDVRIRIVVFGSTVRREIVVGEFELRDPRRLHFITQQLTVY